MTTELDFGIGSRIRDARRCLYAKREEAIDDLGYDIILAATKARRQDMRDALSDREGRKWPVEWDWSIAMVSPEHLRAEFAGCLVKPLGYGISPLVPLTTEQRLARLEYRVATELGTAGQRLVEECQR